MKMMTGMKFGAIAAVLWVGAVAGATEVRLAVASVDQAFMDPASSVQRACDAAKQAASQGAHLVVFSEGFVGGGYPYWLYVQPMLDVQQHSKNYASFVEAAVRRDGPEIQQLSMCARQSKIAMVVPFSERGQGAEIKNAYNAVVMIEKDGVIKSVQRKIQASHNERFYWMTPEDPHIEVVDLAGLRVAYNSCWQNYLPAVRHIQYSQGAQLIVASTQDFGPRWDRLLQTIADEGNVYVASVTQMYKWEDVAAKDAPLERETKALIKRLFNKVTPKLQSGEGMVVAPGGDVVAKAEPFKHQLVFATIDTRKILEAAAYRDVSTNYRLPIEIRYNGRKLTP